MNEPYHGHEDSAHEAHGRGVKQVAVPNPSTKSAERKALQHKRWFRKAMKWRTGCEGRISLLKRRHGTPCLHGHRHIPRGVLQHPIQPQGREDEVNPLDFLAPVCLRPAAAGGYRQSAALRVGEQTCQFRLGRRPCALGRVRGRHDQNNSATPAVSSTMRSASWTIGAS